MSLRIYKHKDLVLTKENNNYKMYCNFCKCRYDSRVNMFSCCSACSNDQCRSCYKEMEPKRPRWKSQCKDCYFDKKEKLPTVKKEFKKINNKNFMF